MYMVNYGTDKTPLWREVMHLTSQYVYKKDKDGTKWCRSKQHPPYKL